MRGCTPKTVENTLNNILDTFRADDTYYFEEKYAPYLNKMIEEMIESGSLRPSDDPRTES